jgi:hypothetical protein
VLGLLGVPSYYHPLLELIADPARSVRPGRDPGSRARRGARAAAGVVASTRRAGAAPARRSRRSWACAGGDLSILGAELRNPARPRELRCQVARSFASIRAEGERASRARGRGTADDFGALGVIDALIGPCARPAGQPGCGPGALRAAARDRAAPGARALAVPPRPARGAPAGAASLLETLERGVRQRTARASSICCPLVYPDLLASSLARGVAAR